MADVDVEDDDFGGEEVVDVARFCDAVASVECQGYRERARRFLRYVLGAGFGEDAETADDDEKFLRMLAGEFAAVALEARGGGGNG